MTPCTLLLKKPQIHMSIRDSRQRYRKSAIIIQAGWTRKPSKQCALSRWRRSSKTSMRSKIAMIYSKRILALETRLAQASRTRVQLRDPQKNYNKLPVSQLQNLTQDWHWSDYFKQINLLEPPNVNVHQPEFFKAADEVFKNTPIEDWKAYLRWQLIDATAAELSKDFVDEDFNFKERVLRGTQQIKPRWKRVIASTDDAIGEALGKLYVAFDFPPQAKARALELVNNLKEALSDRIKTLEWMDEK